MYIYIYICTCRLTKQACHPYLIVHVLQISSVSGGSLAERDLQDKGDEPHRGGETCSSSSSCRSLSVNKPNKHWLFRGKGSAR